MTRSKKEGKEVLKADPQDYITALFTNSSYIELLSSKDGDYEKVRTWFLENERDLVGTTVQMPNMKTISAESGVDYSRMKKCLEAIYYDICELNRIEPHRFQLPGTQLYEVFFHYYKASASFNVALRETPRIGESFCFGFIFPQIRWSVYTVSSVDHEIINGKHIISITVAIVELNQYINLLKDKALMLGNITLDERFGFMPEEQLSKLVRTHRTL